jgi:hypothetical protein
VSFDQKKKKKKLILYHLQQEKERSKKSFLFDIWDSFLPQDSSFHVLFCFLQCFFFCYSVCILSHTYSLFGDHHRFTFIFFSLFLNCFIFVNKKVPWNKYFFVTLNLLKKWLMSFSNLIDLQNFNIFWSKLSTLIMSSYF